MHKLIIDDLKKVAVSLLIAIIAFKLVFFNESIINVIKIVVSFYWLFVLPGNAIMMLFRQYEFNLRLFAGTALGMAVYGLISFYAGMFGLHVQYHWMIFPPLTIASGILFMQKYFKDNQGDFNDKQ